MAFKLAIFLSSILGLANAKFAVTPIYELQKGSTSELSRRDLLVGRDADPESLYTAHTLSVPVDHFHNESMYEPHSKDTFELRYFYDAQFFKDGGPVIVLESGETTATARLPYLQKGLLHQLAKATHGIGVVLEHRYYGNSWPTSDLTTENLRFLTTQQALADTAYFAQHVVFQNSPRRNLTAPATPYIAYGGSYAGAFVAFLRTTYPDIFFGAISSSGVTKAIYDFWKYYEPVKKYGPPTCIKATQQLTNVVDNILIGKHNARLTHQLKAAFGLEDIKYDDDFANALSGGVGGWQGRNWDPAVNDPTFSQYCGNLSATSPLYPSLSNLTSTVKYLIKAGGYGNHVHSLTTQMLNYIGYINLTVVQPAMESGATLDQYYSNHNVTFYHETSIAEASWRSWPYQYCSQWGYLQTGSSVPEDELPLISRALTLEYESIICREAFNITGPANVDIINAYGGFDIAYDRLAFIDGHDDPWRGATPHAPEAKPRTSTTERPFILIDGAVHHWDENGLFPNETTYTLPPVSIVSTQRQEVEFVRTWLKSFRPQ